MGSITVNCFQSVNDYVVTVYLDRVRPDSVVFTGLVGALKISGTTQRGPITVTVKTPTNVNADNYEMGVNECQIRIRFKKFASGTTDGTVKTCPSPNRKEATSRDQRSSKPREKSSTKLELSVSADGRQPLKLENQNAETSSSRIRKQTSPSMEMKMSDGKKGVAKTEFAIRSSAEPISFPVQGSMHKKQAEASSSGMDFSVVKRGIETPEGRAVFQQLRNSEFGSMQLDGAAAQTFGVGAGFLPASGHPHSVSSSGCTPFGMGLEQQKFAFTKTFQLVQSVQQMSFFSDPFDDGKDRLSWTSNECGQVAVIECNSDQNERDEREESVDDGSCDDDDETGVE